MKEKVVLIPTLIFPQPNSRRGIWYFLDGVKMEMINNKLNKLLAETLLNYQEHPHSMDEIKQDSSSSSFSVATNIVEDERKV